MKRILHVISTLEQGGTEAVVLNYFNHIDKEKVMFDFLVIWGEKKGFHEDYLLSKGCRIFKMQNGPNKYFAHGKELKCFFQNQNYDVVHIHAMSALRYRVAKVAKKNGVKKVIYHSHNSSNESHLLIHKILKGRLDRWCDYKFACSKVAGDYMFKGKFTVIPNAIETAVFSFNARYRNEIRNKSNISPDQLIVGNVGRLTEIKNQIYLLLIAQLLKEKCNFLIMIVGEGKQKKRLIEFAKDNGLEDRFIFTGNVGVEVNKYYSAFDVFAFPSKYEGLSMVLMEAQANGLPCVVSNMLSREHKVLGNFIFLPIENKNECYQKWVDSIRKLFQKREDGNAVKENGYDINQAAKNLQEFYLND